MSFPISGEIASAVAKFLYMGAGPTHSQLTRAFASAGFQGADPFDPTTQTPNKQQRVFDVFQAAERSPSNARKLMDGVLDALRLHGSFTDPDNQEDVRNLRAAVAHVGWGLTSDGRLENVGSIDLQTGGREALDEQLERLRRSVDDPGALIGGAKELLEATAKFVLEEGGRLPPQRVDFNGLISMCFEMLAIQPAVVDDSVPGGKQVRAIYQSAKTIVLMTNELRNLQGTGHGRTLPTGVSVEDARFVIREATHVAELMLGVHDRQMGR